MPDSLAQALLARQNDLEKENEWYGAGNQIMRMDSVNPMASVGSNLAAALIKGLGGSLMQNLGQYDVGQQLATDEQILNNIKYGRQPAQGTIWQEKYEPYLNSYAQELAEKQQAQKDREVAFMQDLAKTRYGKELDLQYAPQIELEKKKLDLQYAPQIGVATEQAKSDRERDSWGFVEKAEDDVYKRLESAQAHKDLQQIKPYYEQMEQLLPVNTRAADLGIIYAFAKINDPGSTVREGEVVLSKTASPWLSQMVNSATSELSGAGALSPQTRSAMRDVAKIKYESQMGAYSELAKALTETAKERTGGKAKEERMLPLKLNSGGFTGWATNSKGERQFFQDGVAKR